MNIILIGLISFAAAQTFFVVGDFGDLGDQGRADKNYFDHVTTAMDTTAKTTGVDFMLSVGDNIYENGIESPNDYSYADKIMTYF